MDGSTTEVLLVEDDDGLREALRIHLAGEGLRVRAVEDGPAALDACAACLPDVLVLDLMLPGLSGIEVCTQVRSLYQPSPAVVMVTARDTEADVVLGLDSGADDYVIKPVRPRELLARVRAVLRRIGTPAGPPPAIVRGALRVDPAKRRALVGAVEQRLTATELALLVLLAREPERVWSRLELLETLWSTRHAGYARNVDCHVARLRRKLAAAGLPGAPIETVHGSGYRFVASP
jgi:DNA-binding response OmpR family regulator